MGKRRSTQHGPVEGNPAVQGEQPEPVAQAAPLKIYEVAIPLCMLGERFVLASSPEEAAGKYKKPCGITSHAQPVQVHATNLDPANLPEGVVLYGEE